MVNSICPDQIRFDPLKIPVIIGPTAVGKTELGLNLALHRSLEIISADSMQVYRYMDIGTAKPSNKDLNLVPHHLINIVDPDQEWNLFQFTRMVKKILSNKDKRFLILGGTGLYIKALVYDYQMPKLEPDKNIREELNSISDLQVLYKELEIVDPDAAKNLEPTDRYRITRALEVYRKTGKKISELQTALDEPLDKFQLFCLDMDRVKLYERINQRVDIMIESGLFEEVKALLEKGYSKELPAMQALGYKEPVLYFEGHITREECVSLIKQRTRNFAKRQLTWYRSFPYVQWVNADMKSIF